MRPGGKSNEESPCFETPNLSFEGRDRNVAPRFRIIRTGEGWECSDSGGRDFDLPRHSHYLGVIPMVFQHSGGRRDFDLPRHSPLLRRLSRLWCFNIVIHAVLTN